MYISGPTLYDRQAITERIPRRSAQALEHPRCPFAPVGQQGTPACPGYRHEVIAAYRVPWFSSMTMPAGESCSHLHSQRSSRGFVAACHHPGGLPAGAEAAAPLLARHRHSR
jgi:hypothetical protein